MDFAPSARAQEIRELARDVVRREVDPLEPILLAEGFEAVEDDLQKVRAHVRSTGLFAPHMPESVGGGGLGLLEQAQLSEELGRSPLGHYAFNFAAPGRGQHGAPARLRDPRAAGALAGAPGAG